ncbi:hypothetical protein OM076_28745 [Solirubrobacter ginsenosidimutans]|uniref:Uncharacterized protein n=1 Tax=Solirubrobacter ginsenosidimutans TaxID=490573 RepID=A0A9X3S8D0_9ACTN|nr:hypothetical protein [Solirubrobacter ginsenosidimutans]MDA0164293.1 hypothetical protein [Solirubrobacter ginsenosidimutans]
MHLATAIPLVVTAVLAVAGFVVTYRANLRLAQRKDRLDRVNRQLGELYGPLFALTHASGNVFMRFRSVHWPERQAFFDAPEASSEDCELWRRWMTHAFMPLTRQMVHAVVAHSDLLREEAMPECLIDLCAHVAGYEPIVARWAEPGFDSTAAEDHVSLINFPAEALLRYAEESFGLLRAEQASLLALVQSR